MPMPRPRIQFSVRSMMVWTALAAAWAALFVADPSEESPLSLGAMMLILCTALPPVCGVACIEATGKRRAFWFGVFFVLAIPAFAYLTNFVGGWELRGWSDIEELLRYSAHFRRHVLYFTAIAPVVGLLCMAFHSFWSGGNVAIDHEGRVR